MYREQSVSSPHVPPGDDPAAPDVALLEQSTADVSVRRPSAPGGWRQIGRTIASQALDVGRSGAIRSRQWVAANTLQPTWLAPRWRYPATGYICAAAGQVLAAGLTIGLLAWFPTVGFRSTLFLLVTVVIALWFGAGPSLFSAVLGALLADFLLLTPHYTFIFRSASDLASFGLYLGVGIAISVLPSQVARSRREAQEAHAAALHAEAEALQAKAEAVDRAEQLQTTFDAMADAVALYDAELRLIKCNAAFVHLFGFDHDPDFMHSSIEQRYAESSIQDLHGHVVPLDQLPQVRALHGDASVGDGAVDLHIRTRTGRVADENVTAAPVREVSGAIVGSVAIFRDVTERRRLEQRTEEALTALLEMASVLVAPALDRPSTPTPTPPAEGVSTDQAPASDTVPPARQAAQRVAELTRSVLGCTRVAITAVDPATEVMHPLAVVGLTPEQEAHMWATWPEHARLSDSVHQSEITRLRAGDILTADVGEGRLDAPRNPYRARSVLVAPGLLRGELVCMLTTDYGSEPHVYSLQEQAVTGAVTQLIALVIERERLVTERAQAEARELALRAAQAQMDQFMSLASHELRTPLTTMKANVQIAVKRVGHLLDQARTGAAQSVTLSAREMDALDAALQRAEQAMVRQERLVNDLLDVSRIQSGKLEHHLAPLDLVALTREMVEEQEVAHPQRAIVLDVPEAPIIVQADGDRIRQVLANYLINALRYAPVDQPIAVYVVRNEDARTVRVSVRDQGPGIAASEQTRIWERFYRAPGISHTSGSGVGLGLGLFISREIIERHAGQVGISSDTGKGAEFWFTLPLADTVEG